MDYKNLGRSGLKVSPLCLGTDNFANPTPEAECAAMINAALDAGLNFIDTANVYAKGECERIIGRTLAAVHTLVGAIDRVPHALESVGTIFGGRALVAAHADIRRAVGHRLQACL